MKNLIICLFFIFSIGINLCAQSGSDDTGLFHFSVTGEIEGLAPGDTLSFKRVAFLPWNLEPDFDIIVKEPGKFVYKGSLEHPQYYLVLYKPVSKKEMFTDRSGLTILIQENDAIVIKGTADGIYYSQISGGVFDNPSLQEIFALENDLGSRRADFSRLINEAQATGDTIKRKEYEDKFNFFHRDNAEEYQKLRKLDDDFLDNFPSSQWTIIQMLEQVTYMPEDELKGRLDKMEPEAASSHYGSILRQGADRILSLSVGNNAPDFNLTTLKGENISLKDMKGNYVLIYHWGLCPGSLMIDKQVTDFYEKYKDKLSVVGVTEDIGTIHDLYAKVGPEDEVMNIKLKQVLENMVSHPWYEAELKERNEKLKSDYAFGGLPYFVFISPEGKIIARDFHKAFEKAKQTLETEFPR